MPGVAGVTVALQRLDAPVAGQVPEEPLSDAHREKGGFRMATDRSHALLKERHVDLQDGRFKGTSRDDLERLFDQLLASEKDLVLHFHGGLVSRDLALSAAAKLGRAYEAAYPVFFIWNSDLLTTLRVNLDEIAGEKVFRRMVRRIAQFALSKVLEVPGGRGEGEGLELRSLKTDVPGPLDALAASLARFDDQEETSELTEGQEKQLVDELAEDGEIQRASANIAAHVLPQAEVQQALQSRAIAEPVEPTPTLMSRALVHEIAEERAPDGERALFTSLTLAYRGVRILNKVIGRYLSKRHHGLYATVVEEVLRSLYADRIGSAVWSMMKRDTADAFFGGGARHGGAALIELLRDRWPADRRITLVGHSTGAIYIGHLLEAADDVLDPDLKFDVVFLAPAATFSFIGERLDLFQRRVRDIRMFGLSDELESGYWEIPVLYNRSLLYLVSGLLEPDEVDMPIIGMQRYFRGQPPFDAPGMAEVAAALGPDPVWSISDAGEGSRSEAEKHGAFDDEPVTLASLRHIVENGF